MDYECIKTIAHYWARRLDCLNQTEDLESEAIAKIWEYLKNHSQASKSELHLAAKWAILDYINKKGLFKARHKHLKGLTTRLTPPHYMPIFDKDAVTFINTDLIDLKRHLFSLHYKQAIGTWLLLHGYSMEEIGSLWGGITRQRVQQILSPKP